MVATWWDTTRIEATVTRRFVSSHLTPEQAQRLEQAPGFGDGLTDGTYWEWIEDKAKRFFLILVELGIPGQIFKIVDESRDDEDLPIALDQVQRLGLTSSPDLKFNWRFYETQHLYLIKYIEEGTQASYEEDEVVPLEIVDRRSVVGLSQNHAVDRVTLPNKPGEVFSRRQLPIGSRNGAFREEDILAEINNTKNLQHGHMISYFAYYTQWDYGYVLFKPASDYNLKSLLSAMPLSLKAMDKQVRRTRMMNWIHCLADSLCYLHSRGRSHGNMKPSTILFNSKHHIFFTDLSRLSAENLANSSDRASFNKESYDYAAPEQWYRPATANALYKKTSIASPSAVASGGTTFSISRGGPEPGSALHGPTPNLDPQAADIFSFGCIILELLSLQMKRSSRAFAAHRSAKHKLAGRGGAVLDSSFHKNLGQVESWMAGMVKEASKTRKLGHRNSNNSNDDSDDGDALRGVAPMLQVVARMLSASPHERPTARDVERRMYQILTGDCGVAEPHCVHQYAGGPADLAGLAGLRLSVQGGSDPLAISTRRRLSSGGSGGAGGMRRRASTGGKTTLGPRPVASLQPLRKIRDSGFEEAGRSVQW